jgi:hypothetical protein
MKKLPCHPKAGQKVIGDVKFIFVFLFINSLGGILKNGKEKRQH